MDAQALSIWRAEQRARFIQARCAIPSEALARLRERVTGWLLAGFGPLAAATVAFCWPYRNEIDTRHALRRWRERGARAALPLVVGKGQPLEFRRWWPGAPMCRGALGIPVPVGTEPIRPDAALVPMVAFDAGGYRLGYGGGYFDRTLAVLDPRPIAIGIVLERFALETIHPQSHDLPMDFVVTEEGIRVREGGSLVRIAPEQTAWRLAALACSRGLEVFAAVGGLSAPNAGARLASPVCYAAEFGDDYARAAEPPPGV